jgi:endonuclease III
MYANYASLDELYNNQPTISHRENSYDTIIKNLLQQQTETNSTNIPDPTLASGSKFTTYKKVDDFTNKLNISPKKLEEKIERFESSPKKETISIDNVFFT